MPIPTLPSLTLGFGGGPSQAINTAAPNYNIGYTGPFSAGTGNGGNQTNTLPTTNNTSTTPTAGPFNPAQGDLTNLIMVAIIAFAAVIVIKKVR